MPLIILSGHPCSGKTGIASQLEAKLRKLGLTVLIVSELSLGLDKNDAYKGELDSRVSQRDECGLAISYFLMILSSMQQLSHPELHVCLSAKAGSAPRFNSCPPFNSPLYLWERIVSIYHAERMISENNRKPWIESRPQSIHLLTYADGVIEKRTRGSLKAAVERNLRGDLVIILDSLNNIKGYRYILQNCNLIDKFTSLVQTIYSIAVTAELIKS